MRGLSSVGGSKKRIASKSSRSETSGTDTSREWPKYAKQVRYRSSGAGGMRMQGKGKSFTNCEYIRRCL